GEPRCFGGEYRPGRAEQPVAWHQEAARESADREGQQRNRQLLRQAACCGDGIAEGGGEEGDARGGRQPDEERSVRRVVRSVSHRQQSTTTEGRDQIGRAS